MCEKAISPSFTLLQEKSDVYTLKNTSLPAMIRQHVALGVAFGRACTAACRCTGAIFIRPGFFGGAQGAGLTLVCFRRWRRRIQFEQLAPKAVFFNLEHFGQFAGNKPHGLLLQAAFAKRKLLGAADKQKFA